MTDDPARLAAGCLLAGFDGLEAPARLCGWLEDGLGGVVLFARNVRDFEQVAALTASLRAAQPEVVVAIDEEGGDITRLEARRGSSYPGNRALGVVDDAEVTRAVARAIGGDLAAVGVNLDFAPVADVASNPANPVIGVRSFGSEPALVARHVAAFVSGLQAARVAACAKHFPGHGATAEDSHLELPTLDRPLDAIRAEELVPFRAAIAAGTRAVMTAHIRVPALDHAPATLSRRALTGVLRDELGFDGLIVTDALEMRAVSATVGAEEGAVRALAAGADALCLGHDLEPDAIHRAVVRAVRDGRLSEERLAGAAGRLRHVAGWAAHAGPPAPGDGTIGREAARRALRVEGDAALTRPPFVLELRADWNIAAGRASRGLGDVLRSRLPETTIASVSDAHVGALPDDRPTVLVVRDAHRHQWMQDATGEVVARARDVVVVETGLPVWKPAGAAGYVVTHGAGRANLEAAADALLAELVALSH
jgi:beta-N-acetylhexosaminidase